jgi:NAD+ kinase
MRVALVGQEVEMVVELLRHHGLILDGQDPEVVISLGGDGTLLMAERQYPGIPKLPMRFSETSRKIKDHKADILLDALVGGELVESEQLKLTAILGEQRLLALNDIIFHNEVFTSAVRYRVEINAQNQGGDIIGDGLVVATPFGSTAYYRSITHSIFQVGIGLAFNNSTEPVDHLVLADDSVIQVIVKRGPALVAADNDPNWIHLHEEDCVLVQKAEQPALILSLSVPIHPQPLMATG